MSGEPERTEDTDIEEDPTAELSDAQVEDLEVRTALIEGDTFGPRPVQYSVVDGVAVFEGDIVLGLDEELQRRTEELSAELAEAARGIGAEAAPGDSVDPAEGPVPEAIVIPGSDRRWPGGVVPFAIAANLPAPQAQAARDAVAHWNTNTRLHLRQRVATDAQWIEFQTSQFCRSPVGRQGVSIFTPAPQVIELGAGCGFGAAVHELGHAIGLWHEQSREDRDTFVTIQWANILSGRSHNFDQHISDGDDVGPYDYGSIMHYPPDAFGTPAPGGGTNITIVAKQALPAGVVMGQRNGLSVFDRGAVAWMYGGVYPSPANTWVGRFRGAVGQQLLYYSPARRHWYLTEPTGATMRFLDVGDTTGFGDLADGRPFWAADFTGDGLTDILFYYPGDDNWWLGSVRDRGPENPQCATLRSQIADLRRQITALEQQRSTLNPRDPVDRAEIREINQQVGALRTQINTLNGQMASLGCPPTPIPPGPRLEWSLVGNTAGFGHGINDGRPFWVANFTGNGSADVLFYYPGDDNWWLGQVSGGQLNWSHVGNTAGFGHAINDGRPFWVADFTGNGSADVLFYYPGDDNWWLGQISGGQLNWSHVGNTAGFGHAINDGRPFWIGDFMGNGSADVLFYYPGDDNWWLGQMISGQLTWSFVGNTRGFGHAINDGRPFWIGDFNGNGSADVLFYYPGDDNWWLGRLQDVPPEDPQCAQLRSQIAARNQTIRALEAARATLNPRDPVDLMEIREINLQITAERQQITAAQQQMAALGCGATPNPGGRQLQWSHVGNTVGFGHGINDGRPFWIGDFSGNGSADVLFHYRGDLNWWRGDLSGAALAWTLAANW